MTLIDSFSLLRTMVYLKGHADKEKERKEEADKIEKALGGIIELNCTPLILPVSWS